VATEGQVKRSAIAALTTAAIAIAAAYASAFLPGGATIVSAMLMIVGIATMAVALMILGGVREGTRPGAIALALGFLFVVFVLGFGIPLFFSSRDLWLGLPAATAIVVYGVGILPVFVLPVVYAWTFDARTLSGADIERIKELAKQRANDGSVSD
jgi:hypothetical protein